MPEALFPFLPDPGKKLGLDVVSLLRPDQGDHTDHAALEGGIVRDLLYFIQDGVGPGHVDLSTAFPAVGDVDVNKWRIEPFGWCKRPPSL
ncbi:MAG: hypothetical protein QF437_17640 [Planctomycetota bacterium]|nr:hypothetical protein [Planctomycetota bacterium]